MVGGQVSDAASGLGIDPDGSSKRWIEALDREISKLLYSKTPLELRQRANVVVCIDHILSGVTKSFLVEKFFLHGNFAGLSRHFPLYSATLADLD